jgi:hypothetical protein
MRSWVRTTWGLVAIAALGCGAIEYRNEKNPGATPAQLNSDASECRQSSMVPDARGFAEYDRQVFVVDQSMLARCMAARGWVPAPR